MKLKFVSSILVLSLIFPSFGYASKAAYSIDGSALRQDGSLAASISPKDNVDIEQLSKKFIVEKMSESELQTKETIGATHIPHSMVIPVQPQPSDIDDTLKYKVNDKIQGDEGENQKKRKIENTITVSVSIELPSSIPANKAGAILKMLSEQTGLSIEKIAQALCSAEKASRQIDKSRGIKEGLTFASAVDELYNLSIAKEPIIVTCGMYAVDAILNAGEKVVGLAVMLTDIIINGASQINRANDGQVGSTKEAQLEVLRAFGLTDVANYNLSINQFVNNFQDGESAVLYVRAIAGNIDDGHAITVKKSIDENGEPEYTIVDNSIARTYTQENFIKAITGGKFIDKQGRTNAPCDEYGNPFRYYANDPKQQGRISVSTQSSSLAQLASNKKNNISVMKPNKNAPIQSFLAIIKKLFNL